MKPIAHFVTGLALAAAVVAPLPVIAQARGAIPAPAPTTIKVFEGAG